MHDLGCRSEIRTAHLVGFIALEYWEAKSAECSLWHEVQLRHRRNLTAISVFWDRVLAEVA